ncbi:hypothetical protein HHI36_010558 [Cryptolaemus montrouzieri]|uniref:Uncharacterized protein n=1 Tax=Cryptolaemus montrouzieri TaxID=559131 RepID=A0ABD2MJU2_9CUCU
MRYGSVWIIRRTQKKLLRYFSRFFQKVLIDVQKHSTSLRIEEKGVMNRINDRDAMFKSVRANPGNRELKDRYNELRAQIKLEVKTAKLRYYRDKIASNLSNPKKYGEL